jgi:hypothetical protein
MKKSTILAKITAFENACEFIRSHGEEGGLDEETFEEFTLDEYLNQCKVVANIIERKKQQLLKKHGYTEIDQKP